MAKYSLLENTESRLLSVFVDGDFLTADHNNPNFDLILDRVRNDDLDGIQDLFELQTAIREYFAKVSELVSVSNGQVLYDGTAVANELTEFIVKLYEQDADASAFILFFEKLQANPNPHSIEHLYRWIKDRNLTITSEGNFVAYKGLRDDYSSITHGPGIVNGVPQNGGLDNSPGNVLEMARSDVEFDPSVGCSTGLHAGTWDYASRFAGYSGKVVEVHINPRDVVSVPTDCHDSKLRVSRYTVVDDVSGEYDSAYLDYSDYEDDDDEDDVVDTKFNYMRQDRDERGRFV